MVEADPAILDAAEKLFKTKGFHEVLMAEIADEVKIALPAIQSHYNDKIDLLQALLDRRSPKDAIRKTLKQMKQDNPETMVRETVHKMIELFRSHNEFMELAMLDLQVNNGAYATILFQQIAGESAAYVNRLTSLPGVRPVSVVMLGRAFSSILIGFLLTEQLAPKAAQFAMKMFPTKAWIDGVADIFLYGILEQE